MGAQRDQLHGRSIELISGLVCGDAGICVESVPVGGFRVGNKLSRGIGGRGRAQYFLKIFSVVIVYGQLRLGVVCANQLADRELQTGQAEGKRENFFLLQACAKLPEAPLAAVGRKIVRSDPLPMLFPAAHHCSHGHVPVLLPVLEVFGQLIGEAVFLAPQPDIEKQGSLFNP